MRVSSKPSSPVKQSSRDLKSSSEGLQEKVSTPISPTRFKLGRLGKAVFHRRLSLDQGASSKTKSSQPIPSLLLEGANTAYPSGRAIVGPWAGSEKTDRYRHKGNISLAAQNVHANLYSPHDIPASSTAATEPGHLKRLKNDSEYATAENESVCQTPPTSQPLELKGRRASQKGTASPFSMPSPTRI